MNMKRLWSVLSKKKVYENNWISVEHNDVITPAGKFGVYGVVRPKNYAIAVLAIEEDYTCWIVGQYRFATDTYEWELPKGGCLIGEEEPMEAGIRELREETGITASSWHQILDSRLSNCFTDESSFSYVAKDLKHQKSEPDENERIDLRKVGFEELVDMCIYGEIKCALSQATIVTAKVMKDRGLL